MTLTIPGCPLANQLVEDVKRKVESLEGVKEAEVELVF
ncbi:MAG: iron-sulfur cluster assembly protein [Candidatus Atribacteria bacterium]|nr:iron-sulfur cluster assembly protein [Candidatus Atribacteria bacterium]